MTKPGGDSKEQTSTTKNAKLDDKKDEANDGKSPAKGDEVQGTPPEQRAKETAQLKKEINDVEKRLRQRLATMTPPESLGTNAQHAFEEDKKHIEEVLQGVERAGENLSRLLEDLDKTAGRVHELEEERKALAKRKDDPKHEETRRELDKELDAAKARLTHLDSGKSIMTALLMTIPVEREAAQAVARRDLAAKEKDLQTTKTQLSKQLAESRARQAELDQLNDKLGKRLQELEPNPSVIRDVERVNKHPKKELLIGFKPGKRAEAELLCRALGLELVRVNEDLQCLTCHAQRPVTAETLQVLSECKSVIKFAGPNVPARSDTVPRPPPELEDRGERGAGEKPPLPYGTPENDQRALLVQHGWNLALLDVKRVVRAVPLMRDAQPIIVAVIDSGVDYRHPDLRDIMWTGPDGRHGRSYEYGMELAGLDGLPDAALHRRRSLVTDEPLNDAVAHGTHIAGIIARMTSRPARPPRRSGNFVRIMGLNAYLTDDYAAAIRFATNNGARIINLSVRFPTPADFKRNELIEAAVRYATDHGVLVVCSAGNEQDPKKQDLDRPENFSHPASYGLKKYGDRYSREFPDPLVNDSLLSVAALGPDYRLTSYSCYGKEVVALAAPGGYGWERTANEAEDLSLGQPNEVIQSAIPTTLDFVHWRHPPRPDCPYGNLFGTSLAAPHVAAAAVLIWSHPEYQHLTAVELKALIKERMMPKPPGGKPSDQLAVGLLDLSFLCPPLHAEQVARRQLGTGLHYFFEHQWREAFECLQEAMEYAPDDSAPYYFAALALAGMGQDERATASLRSALELDELDADEWGRMTELLQGTWRQSLEEARRAARAGKSRQILTMWSEWRQSVAPRPSVRATQDGADTLSGGR